MSALPSWPERPANLDAAVVETKAAIRHRIEQRTGRSVESVVEQLESELAKEVATIAAERERGRQIFPEVDFEAIANGSITEQQRAKIQQRGCVVIRGHFARERAEAWDSEIIDYAERNNFFEAYRGEGDDFFADVSDFPAIYPLYWSPPQREVRADRRMAEAQQFLNGFWEHESDGRQWFDPNGHSDYPDRIRRRPPGTDASGLGLHIDTGKDDLWLSKGYQQAFDAVFSGELDRYDPWAAAHRVEALQFAGSTMCSAFRTFQGWVALSDMASDQGVLHTIPIPRAFAYVLLRPLMSDVADDDLCGVDKDRALALTDDFHSVLLPALSPIPSIEPGDSVWWHCDVAHAVAPVKDQDGWGNVMYVPAAPRCERNDRYAVKVAHAMATGESPPDFPPEHYEVGWS